MSCFRCGRYGHFADECYVKSHSKDRYHNNTEMCFNCGRFGHWANSCYKKARFEPHTVICFRCGREGHTSPECYANTKSDGTSFQTSPVTAATNTQTISQSTREGVYVVLAIPSAIFYVGKSRDIDSRIMAHGSGEGAMCITGQSVVEVPLMTSGDASDLESWERNETLALMKTHGISKVRGWMFTSHVLSEQDTNAAFRQICEKYDLCRKCGHDSHFAEHCFSACKAAWAVGCGEEF